MCFIIDDDEDEELSQPLSLSLSLAVYVVQVIYTIVNRNTCVESLAITWCFILVNCYS